MYADILSSMYWKGKKLILLNLCRVPVKASCIYTFFLCVLLLLFFKFAALWDFTPSDILKY